ncbi:cyclopropane fatty acyl phospholipid synthase [Malikia sp.]|uniref:cyclopropane fatty acyl phospholipid synthase n=1 Tax=Malikia sp. TaxID=2070706 RepID=UPI00262F1134|nr:cyclopropane fatty acyl phospholipid synthase [Malikia sp.]MDD2727744.1 cyclopropane fatty acyl phospholipid synthase [Malikia sp.]
MLNESARADAAGHGRLAGGITAIDGGEDVKDSSTMGAPAAERKGLRASQARAAFERLLALADVRVGGNRPWDIQIHHPGTFDRVLGQGSLGLGESYMDGWWDCERIDEFICRALRAGLDRQVRNPALLLLALKARLINMQSPARAWQVGQTHYDTGNLLFEAMLDPTMSYSCGYWNDSATLEQAQRAKLELICRKLQLRPGMTLLDIGCGWGGLMRHAAEHHGVSCVGLTISREQASWARDRLRNLPVRIELADYRDFNADGSIGFDRVASVGMFEHVGHRNYSAYFRMARRSLHEDGLFLLHTIGKNHPGAATDPWIARYVFPNGELPTAGELCTAAEPDFVIEDLHNFGADYAPTLMAWLARFDAAWPRLREHYPERFRRMWRYYLMACAGASRARDNQLWQLVLSPRGAAGGYRRPLA